jgi:sporulation protein YunB
MLPKKKKNTKILIVTFLFFFIIVLIFLKIDKDIKPVLLAVSDTEVRAIATESINRIIKEELSKNVKYSDFVTVKTDKNGDIAAIDLDAVEMNKFGSNIALSVQSEMKSIGERGISIPLGVITGSTLLAYYGPRMNVKVLPMGYISTDFKSELQSAGINQTRYVVYIKVDTNLQLMIPLGKDKINVTTTIPIAETLIVGKVPSSYFNTGQNGTNQPNIITVPIPETKQ